MRHKLQTLLVMIIIVSGCRAVPSQSIDLANDYFQHGLNDKAKEALIGICHGSSATPATKAKALYLLGGISFDEHRTKVAISDWQTLVKEYPDSSEAKEIKDRLSELSEIIAKSSASSVNSVVAGSYISNGDFWSKGNETFMIDSSWLSDVELANDWYDRVLKEFPKTDAAEEAYEKKLKNLIGSRERGSDGDKYGLKANFNQYIPQVLATFSAFETEFPNNPTLQAFRYQIAQAYWDQKMWTQAQEWLQKIIDKGSTSPSFYTETAKARLNKLKY